MADVVSNSGNLFPALRRSGPDPRRDELMFTFVFL